MYTSRFDELTTGKGNEENQILNGMNFKKKTVQ